MITVLLFVLGVVVFAVGVAVSIGLHEVGHMVPAKKFGVKVTIKRTIEAALREMSQTLDKAS